VEADYHSVEEYMKHVEEYYQRLEIKEGKEIEVKRVFVASDDPKVLPELIQKFPDYTFIGDVNVSKSAALSTRLSSTSFKGILSDINILSRSDYLVCTLSSQICQLAYEIMQQVPFKKYVLNCLNYFKPRPPPPLCQSVSFYNTSLPPNKYVLKSMTPHYILKVLISTIVLFI
jgi:hypothetical protein